MKTILNKKESLYLKDLLFTKGNKFTSAAHSAIQELCSSEIRWTYTSGSGKYSTYKDTPGAVEIKAILKLLNIKHIGDNDSPRGGVLGEYTKITDKRFLELRTKVMPGWDYSVIEDLLIEVIKDSDIQKVQDKLRGRI